MLKRTPVSKMRLSRILQSGLPIDSADLQALFYAMNLTCEPNTEGQAFRYQATKMAIMLLEQHGQYSTNMLGAYAVLAMYEVGQALFPAAYLTVSGVARLFCALGLHDKKKATQLMRRPDTWVEVEERRRIWWSVLMLDRYVHIGFRFRPLSTPGIPPDEIIPAKDRDWDVGVRTRSRTLELQPMIDEVSGARRESAACDEHRSIDISEYKPPPCFRT